MTSTLFSADMGLARIRNIVAGREEGIPRGEAMIRLREARFPHAHRDFEALLASESEPPLIRALAIEDASRGIVLPHHCVEALSTDSGG